MEVVLLISFLTATILIGCTLYYFCGILKRIGVTTVEEMNDSDLFVTSEGILEEEFPDDLVTEADMTFTQIIGRGSFLVLSVFIWLFIGITTGRVAFLLFPPDLYKIIVYFLMYMIFLRIPFGVMNKSIERSFEVKVMPEKLIIAIVMIGGFVIALNAYERLPDFLTWHFGVIR